MSTRHLLVISQYPFGTAGTCTQVRWLLKALEQKSNYNLSVVCCNKKWPATNELPPWERIHNSPEIRRYSFNGIELFVCKKIYNGENGAGETLARVIPLLAEKYDCAILVAGSLGLGLGLTNTNLPFISWIATTFKSENEYKTGFSFKSIVKRARYWLKKEHLAKQEQLVSNMTRKICAISTFSKQAIVSQITEATDKTCIIPIPVASLKEVVRKKVQPGKILFAGRFTDPRKDIKTLIRAFKTVLQFHQYAHLTIAGERVSNSLKSFVNKLKLAEHVDFPGKVNSLAQEYSTADIVVIPSLQEGLCMTALEAMSFGIPVVSTRCGGPEDFIIDGKTGLLTPIHDEKEMAEAIMSILENELLKQQLGKAGKKLVTQKYNEELIFSKIIRCIDALY